MAALVALAGRLVQALALVGPLLLGWLAGRRGAEAKAAGRVAGIQEDQLESAAKPHESPDRILDRMRRGGL